MHPLKKNFIQLIIGLFAILFGLIALSMILAKKVQAAEPVADATVLPNPVSINALMVTLIDHSAHYIWDYGSMEREVTPEEWRTVEYYAIQLAGAGSLITIGGSGPLDATWVKSPEWLSYSKTMSDAAMLALDASKAQDKAKLLEVGDKLIASCEGCHEAFKPEVPTEGFSHQPDYDYLYHLFR
jgi:hypothetical protein